MGLPRAFPEVFDAIEAILDARRSRLLAQTAEARRKELLAKAKATG